MEGRLIGVGVGPGDPELLTLAAVRAIRESDCILLPNEKKEECYAYKIVRQVVPEIEDLDLITTSKRQIPEKGLKSAGN